MLDELKANQWDEQRKAGEGEAEIPLDLDPDLLPTLHIFTAEGNVQFMTDEALQKRLAQTQNTAPNPPEPQEPATQQQVKAPPPVFPFYLLILLFFLLLDSGSSYLTVVLAPTATITIQPNSQSISMKSAATLGKLLSPITVTQSQTIATTGHGHQDARQATGTVIFYNTAFTSQTVDAGTVITGADGVKIITDETVSIPSDNPPVNGQAIISAHALDPGGSGNISALDMNGIFSNMLYVKNLAAFTGGQDARDFQIVTKADRDAAATTLKAKVFSSMTAALQGQLMQGEQLRPTPCTPTTTANHAIGQEAATVQVVVSETCTAIAYDMKTLTIQATRQLTTQATRKLGQGYMLTGRIQVTVTKATIQHKTVTLVFTSQATYTYQLTAQAQQRIKALIAGKPRFDALRIIKILPGVQTVNIAGVSDDQPIPDDMSHISLLLIVEG